MKYTEIEEIIVRATAGAELSNCIKESLKLAASEWQNVLLKHNDKKYRVNLYDIFSKIRESSEQT